MSQYSIKITDAAGNVKFSDSAENFASLVVREAYAEGDRILVEVSEKGFVQLQLDEVLGESLVYLTENICYTVPFGEQRYNLPPKAFDGALHYLFVRKAEPEAVNCYRNLAYNRCDQHGIHGMYPHASANVETRGESVFFAGNAIDGVLENRGHGCWPFASWGINRQDDAELTIDFGREVIIDKAAVTIRADFPHDNWWTQVTLRFSDGSEEILPLEKTRFRQVFHMKKRKTVWVKFGSCIKADDPSPFPALTQLELYGTEAAEENGQEAEK